MLALHGPLFSDFRVRCGSDAGAREMWETAITDLVDCIQPDLAMDVAGPGGRDWGIDTYVGSLDGDVYVWQSKFYLTFTKDTQSDVRGSFNMVVKKAISEGFTLISWTLCIPCVLDPTNQKWFDGWKKTQFKKTGVRIDLWNGSKIRRWLMTPDADDVRRHYFEPGAQVAPDEPLSTLPDITSYLTDALFVKQLHEAGHVETDAARGFFFATDALIRDLQQRGDATAVQGLEELSAEIHGLWESRFNAAQEGADEHGRMVGLVDDVLEGAATLPPVAGLRAKPGHRRGMTHRLVEYQRAGWVTHWRELAAEYGESPPEQFFVAHQPSGEAQ
jgi:hypothetical protein